MDKPAPVLCGGTFFTLLLETRTRNRIPSQRDALNGLMQIYNPSYAPLKGPEGAAVASRFRNCQDKLAPYYFYFGEERFVHSFNERMDKEYLSLVEQIKKFIDGKFNLNKWLISALLELLEDDVSISNDTRIRITSDNSGITKTDILKYDGEYNFFCFILGVWHYICINPFQAGRGRETFKSWTEEPYDKYDKNKFNSRIGLNRYTDIEVSYAFPPEAGIYRGAKSESSDIPKSPYISNREYNKTPASIGDKKSDVHDVKAPQLANYAKKSNIKFAAYFANASKALSLKPTFLYKTERAFYDFYVPNDITPLYDAPIQLWNFNNPLQDTRGDRITDVHTRNIISKHTRAMLVGAGGVGKSSMLNHLFLDTIKQYNEEIVPILITIRSFVPAEHELMDFILLGLKRYDKELTINDLRSLMEKGAVILLLDGIDEINPSIREAFNYQLEMLLDQFHNLACIMTSRHGLWLPAMSKFSRYELQPLTRQQAIRLIEKVDSTLVSEDVKRYFVEQIERGVLPSLQEFSDDFIGNPLLLTIMVATYSRYRNIPDKHYVFYERAYESLAEVYDKTTKGLQRSFSTGLSKTGFKTILGAFSAQAYFDGVRSFDDNSVRKYAEMAINAEQCSCTIDEFLTDATETTSMMVVDGHTYEFIHPSFQEYFAAYYFSLQPAESFDAIFDLFMSRDFVSQRNHALEMLYEIEKEKTIVYILIPYLHRLLDTDEYHAFLCETYQRAVYNVGECNPYALNIPASTIFSLVCDATGIASSFFLDDEDVPFSKDFIAETFFYIGMSGENQMEYVEEEPAGYVCSIEFNEFYNNDLYKDYPEISAAIDSDVLEFRKVYNEAKQCLPLLEKKYLNQSNPTSFLQRLKSTK